MEIDKIHQRAEYLRDTAQELNRMAQSMVELAKDAQFSARLHREAEQRDAIARAKGFRVFSSVEETHANCERDLKDTMTAARNQLDTIKQDVLRLETDLGGLERVIL